VEIFFTMGSDSNSKAAKQGANAGDPLYPTVAISDAFCAAAHASVCLVPNIPKYTCNTIAMKTPTCFIIWLLVFATQSDATETALQVGKTFTEDSRTCVHRPEDELAPNRCCFHVFANRQVLSSNMTASTHGANDNVIC
jgi:hypothetical protein